MNRTLYAMLALLLLIGAAAGYVHHNRARIAGLEQSLQQEKVSAARARGERDGYREAVAARDRQRKADLANQRAAESAAATYHRRSEHEKQGFRDAIARLRSGELQLHPRFGCAAPAPASAADAAVDSRAPAGPATGGLQVADAEVLVGLAEDADQVTLERNQAVEGWAACRAISESPPPR